MENKLLDVAAFKKLEKMPTKTELIATIARLIKMVSASARPRPVGTIAEQQS